MPDHTPVQGGNNIPRIKELKSLDRYAIERFTKEANARHVSDLRPHVDSKVLGKMSKLLADFDSRFESAIDFRAMIKELLELRVNRKSKTVYAAIGAIRRVGNKFRKKRFRRYMRQVKIVLGALKRETDQDHKNTAEELLLKRIAKTAPKSLCLSYLRIKDKKMTGETAYSELVECYERKRPFEECLAKILETLKLEMILPEQCPAGVIGT